MTALRVAGLALIAAAACVITRWIRGDKKDNGPRGTGTGAMTRGGNVWP